MCKPRYDDREPATTEDDAAQKAAEKVFEQTREETIRPVPDADEG